MNISKRDKYILIAVFTLLAGVAYYTFFYKNQVSELAQAKRNKNEAITEYNKVMSELETLEERKGDIKELTASSLNKSLRFYPTINQEKIILELEEMMKKVGFMGSISFTEVEVGEVENITPIPPKLDDTTFHNAAKYIRNKESKEENQGTNSIVSKKEESEVVSNNITTNGVTCEKFEATITFIATYDELRNFKLELEQFNRRIISPSMVVEAGGSNLTGTIKLEFFALPKLDKSDDNYLNWTISNIYGKDELFAAGNATGTFSTSIEEVKANEMQNDFVAMVKSSSSVHPTLTFGKANDEYCKTYIYNYNAGISEVVLTLTKVGDKYYYKYSAGNDKYPNTTIGNGEEFDPKGNVIKLDIQSEGRINSEDKSGIKLRVVNNSGMTVEIKVNNDDASTPRVEVTGEGDAVITK